MIESNKAKSPSKRNSKKQKTLSRMANYLKRTRLGEMLVSMDLVSPGELKAALQIQKRENRPLGLIFLEASVLNRRQLAYALARQYILRCAATSLLSFMALTGFSGKRAMADTLQDIPAKISVSFNNAGQYERMTYYPALFGTNEKRSDNLSPFTKWTGMFKKFDQDLKSSEAKSLVAEWQKALQRYQGQDLKTMAAKVNDFINEKRYITDNKNWGQSDYWATPVEFMKRGGDCEDFAIAKYTALRMLGVPEERLRIMIVHDNLKNIPHAILVVYTRQGAFALDNQIKTLVDAESSGRYRPIFSINRTAWWLHTAPSATQIASR